MAQLTTFAILEEMNNQNAGARRGTLSNINSYC